MSDLKNGKMQALSEEDLDNVSGGYNVIDEKTGELIKQFKDRRDAEDYVRGTRWYKVE